MARLDRAYIGDWARSRGGKTSILEGYSTISDHLPCLLSIKPRLRNEETDRSFRFNLSFLENITIVDQLKTIWNAETKPTPYQQGWQQWVVRALSRIKLLCQNIGIEHAKARKARTTQLKASLASAE